MVKDRVPAPSYEFEMINKNGTFQNFEGERGGTAVEEKTLFLHYKVCA